VSSNKPDVFLQQSQLISKKIIDKSQELALPEFNIPQGIPLACINMDKLIKYYPIENTESTPNLFQIAAVNTIILVFIFQDWGKIKEITEMCGISSYAQPSKRFSEYKGKIITCVENCIKLNGINPPTYEYKTELHIHNLYSFITNEFITGLPSKPNPLRGIVTTQAVRKNIF
jgi:hypothetical protein